MNAGPRNEDSNRPMGLAFTRSQVVFPCWQTLRRTLVQLRSGLPSGGSLLGVSRLA